MKEQSDKGEAETGAAAIPALPRMEIVGPTVHDDIRRAIWRYGEDAVKLAVKEATKAKRGRKREPDLLHLQEVIEADARDWLAGNDPFAARSNYSIAKELSERNPGHSMVSTHQRIERKLSKGPRDRHWLTLVSAVRQSRDAGPYAAHLRALEALTALPNPSELQVWQRLLESARSIISDFQAREGTPPPSDLTFGQVEATARKHNSLLNYVLETKPTGLFGSIAR